jgi:hypothetical protein
MEKHGHKVSRILAKAHVYKNELHPSTRTPSPSTHFSIQLVTLPAKRYCYTLLLLCY